MFLIFWLTVVCALGHSKAQGQRVAPGVPPQHYQQHGGQQMHQQVPQQMHQQQIPQQQIHQQQHQQPQQQQQQQQQFQQVPVQQPQHQQQIPVQQVPIQQAAPHSHDHGHHPQQILNTANIAHERDHIAEHAPVPMDTSKMTDQELQFHYFKMHDSDNNNKLDGSELIKSLIHWHAQGNAEPNPAESAQKVFSDDEFCNLIDPILKMDDLNKDGYIDYPEFIQAQQKAAASSPPVG